MFHRKRLSTNIPKHFFSIPHQVAPAHLTRLRQGKGQDVDVELVGQAVAVGRIGGRAGHGDQAVVELEAGERAKGGAILSAAGGDEIAAGVLAAVTLFLVAVDGEVGVEERVVGADGNLLQSLSDAGAQGGREQAQLALADQAEASGEQIVDHGAGRFDVDLVQVEDRVCAHLGGVQQVPLRVERKGVDGVGQGEAFDLHEGDLGQHDPGAQGKGVHAADHGHRGREVTPLGDPLEWIPYCPVDRARRAALTASFPSGVHGEVQPGLLQFSSLRIDQDNGAFAHFGVERHRIHGQGHFGVQFLLSQDSVGQTVSGCFPFPLLAGQGREFCVEGGDLDLRQTFLCSLFPFDIQELVRSGCP